MEAFKPSYTTVTTLGDFGPWVSSLILSLPTQIRAADLAPLPFSVYVERREQSGEVLMHQELGDSHSIPLRGYLSVREAFPCDAEGQPCAESNYVSLELPECRLTKTIEGGVTLSRFAEPYFRITQTAPLPGEDPVCGLVFEEKERNLIPQLAGWKTSRMSQPVNGIQLQYGYYTPDFSGDVPTLSPFSASTRKPQKAALIIWLHGAGEGGSDVELAYTGNRVTALSEAKIQKYFGGAAWVLVPQSPTFWMDDGKEQLGRSNKSIYTEPLKALIDEFIAEHADRIDTSRIIIGGLSNGGFMTVRMCADYPEFFAAGIPTCAPFFTENQASDVVDALAHTPLWFVHSKGDELVDPTDTVLPLYRLLSAVGAPIHMTYFDHVEDLTGRYREADGTPKKTFNHGVWIHVYNDFCRTEIDGTNVMINSEPVGLWEWAARQQR